MSDRCEPPERLRGVDGWHWVQCPEGTEQACRWRGKSERWPPYWSGFDGPPNDAREAYELGWRYLAPVAPPALVRALVEALEQAEACMSIVEPRSDKAEYLRILGVIRAVLLRAKEAGV